MPKRRPQISGYERIAQAEVAEDDQEERAGREGPTANYNDGYDGNAGNTGGPTIALHGPQYAPIQPGRHESMPAADTHRHNKRRSVGGSPRHRRQRSNSGIDIKAINARLERWADEIASKLRIRRVRGKTPDEERLEIAHSVFQAPAWIQPVIAADMVRDRSAGESERMTDLDFEKAVDDVRTAIELGTHPTLISQGSSGSYFARTADGKVVGVFKPKDEEPYASRNPKWTKWIHRNLFPFFFGRACLIPNLSYVSEAAAYVLDCQLQTNLVPYTDVVSLSSKSFHYDLWDRRAFYRKKKPLPEKVGSFQVFLKGYQDATHFLREHPWPDQPQSTFRALALPRQKRRRSRRRNASKNASVASDDDDEASELTASEPGSRAETDFWTAGVRQPFREELEKLVILDYIMRNTDRGLDNWMIRFDGPHSVGRTGRQTKDVNGNASSGQNGSLTAHHDADKSSTEAADAALRSRMIIGAIDNSLSWPWKHPDAVS